MHDGVLRKGSVLDWPCPPQWHRTTTSCTHSGKQEGRQQPEQCFAHPCNTHMAVAVRAASWLWKTWALLPQCLLLPPPDRSFYSIPLSSNLPLPPPFAPSSPLTVTLLPSPLLPMVARPCAILTAHTLAVFRATLLPRLAPLIFSTPVSQAYPPRRCRRRG